MPDKPPKAMTKREKEEQYFAEQEQLKRKSLREKLDQERESTRKDNLRETHWMKCPKCGHDLAEKKYEDILIDQCSTCRGIWLDPGELELLLSGQKAKGFLTRFMDTHVRGKG